MKFILFASVIGFGATIFAQDNAVKPVDYKTQKYTVNFFNRKYSSLGLNKIKIGDSNISKGSSIILSGVMEGEKRTTLLPVANGEYSAEQLKDGGVKIESSCFMKSRDSNTEQAKLTVFYTFTEGKIEVSATAECLQDIEMYAHKPDPLNLIISFDPAALNGATVEAANPSTVDMGKLQNPQTFPLATTGLYDSVKITAQNNVIEITAGAGTKLKCLRSKSALEIYAAGFLSEKHQRNYAVPKNSTFSASYSLAITSK